MADAIRVARRAVVLKERPLGREFARLSLPPDKLRTSIAYGIHRKEEST